MRKDTFLPEILKIYLNTSIYETSKKRYYSYCGEGTYLNQPSIIYSIPKRDQTGYNYKKIRTSHLTAAILKLLSKGYVTRKDLAGNDCSSFCNFSAFYGLLNTVAENIFEKKHGKIVVTD